MEQCVLFITFCRKGVERRYGMFLISPQNHTRRRLGASLMLVVISACLSCASIASEKAKLSLDEALKIALEKNPELQAAKARAESMEAKVTAESSLPPPEVGVEFWGIGGESTAQERWYSIMQTVPFPTKIFTKTSSASHSGKREREMAKSMEREILAKVKHAYYELFYATKVVGLYQEQVEILSRLAKSAGAKYSVGKGTQGDLLQAQVELAKMENMRESAKKDREAAEAALNTRLDQPPSTPLGEPVPPKPVSLPDSIERLEELALRNRPEVRAAHHHVGHMEAEVSRSRQEFLPDFGVKYSYRKRPGMKDDSVIMVTMSVPFLFFWKPAAEARSSSRELLEAESELRSVSNNTRLDVRDHLSKCQNHLRLVKTYESSVLPQTKQSLRVSESAYIADRVKFFDYLSSQRSYLSFHQEYYQSLKEYGQNLAELERVVGNEIATEEKEQP